MTASIWVTEADSLTNPDDIDATTLWVILDETCVWETPLTEASSPDPFRLARRARNGPLWGPFITVEVVVRLVGAGSDSHLLRAADQMIWRSM